MNMKNECMKRGHLLPEGGKDLIDVLKSKEQPSPPMPSMAREISVAAKITVGELAAVLAQKPFQIIADLTEMGVFANLHQEIDFATSTRVARKHGFTLKRTV